MTSEHDEVTQMDDEKRPQDDAMKSAPIPDANAGDDTDEAGRPTGTSTARDRTGVDPQDPIIRPADEQSG